MIAPFADIAALPFVLIGGFPLRALRRFGVEFSREPSSTEHIEKSESYMAWFEFWNNHFKSMNKEVYNQFVDDKLAGKDISKYMPAGSWKDSLTKKR